MCNYNSSYIKKLIAFVTTQQWAVLTFRMCTTFCSTSHLKIFLGMSRSDLWDWNQSNFELTGICFTEANHMFAVMILKQEDRTGCSRMLFMCVPHLGIYGAFPPVRNGSVQYGTVRFLTFSTRVSTSYLVLFFVSAQSRFQVIPTGNKTDIKQTDQSAVAGVRLLRRSLRINKYYKYWQQRYK